MSYEKLGFTSGQTLKAEHLNHMEDGIANAGGAEIIEATVNTEFTNALNLPTTSTKIFEKVVNGQDVMIKATITKSYEDHTVLFRVVDIRNSCVFFSTAMPVLTSQGIKENRCYLAVDAGEETTIAEYQFAT